MAGLRWAGYCVVGSIHARSIGSTASAASHVFSAAGGAPAASCISFAVCSIFPAGPRSSGSRSTGLGQHLGRHFGGRETRLLSRGDGDESEARAAHLPLVTAQQAEATKSARDVLLTRERAVQLQAELVEAAVDAALDARARALGHADRAAAPLRGHLLVLSRGQALGLGFEEEQREFGRAAEASGLA